MSDQQIVEGLWNSIGHASWPVVIGYAILAICVAVKGFTEGKAHGEAKTWIGVTVAMFVGVGTTMALGSDWIHMVVMGLIVGGSSSGFWAKVKSKIPDFGKPTPVPKVGP